MQIETKITGQAKKTQVIRFISIQIIPCSEFPHTSLDTLFRYHLPNLLTQCFNSINFFPYFFRQGCAAGKDRFIRIS